MPLLFPYEETDQLNTLLTQLVPITGTDYQGLDKNAKRFDLATVDAPADAANPGIDPKQKFEMFICHVPVDAQLFLNNEKIKKIRVFMFHGTIMAAARLEISFANGEKKLYGFKKLATINAFLTIIVPYSLKFLQNPTPPALKNWEAKENPAYAPYEKIYRTKVHPAIADALYYSLIAENLTDKTILLISAGTSTGGDLMAVQQKLAGIFKLQLAGIDINIKDIEQAKKALPKAVILKGSVDELPKHIEEINENVGLPHQNRRTIIIFSGILSHQVSASSTHALRRLQLATRVADYIAVSSFTTSFIYPDRAKAAGLIAAYTDSVELTNNSKVSQQTHAPVFVWRQQTSDERLTYLLTKARKRNRANTALNQLDLAMSGNPLRDLQLIQEKAADLFDNIKQIDLAWAYFTEEETTLIDFLTTKLPNLERILIAPTQQTLQAKWRC